MFRKLTSKRREIFNFAASVHHLIETSTRLSKDSGPILVHGTDSRFASSLSIDVLAVLGEITADDTAAAFLPTIDELMFTREQLASEEGIGSAVASTSVIVKAFPAVDTSIVQIDHFRIMRPDQFHDRTKKSILVLVEAFDHTLFVAHSVAQDLSNSIESRASVTKVGVFFAVFHEIGNVVFQNGILGIECQFCN